jgi:integrase
MMGSIFHKHVTKPLPIGSKIFEKAGKQWASWTNRWGKPQSAPLAETRHDRIVVKAKTYTAKYRDGAGTLREVATGCRDVTAARKVLSDLEVRAVHIKTGINTAHEDALIDHQKTPIDEHFEEYQRHLTSKGNNRNRIKDDKHRFHRIKNDCGFCQLADLRIGALVTWLERNKADGMSAGTRNEYRKVMVGFGNWCVANKRLLENPFAGSPRADAKTDQRRKRRSLTELELDKLLAVAERRPLDDAQTIRRGKNAGKRLAKVRPDVQQHLELLGRERALIYKTLVLTGLRKNELATLTIGQLYLDCAHPYAELDPEDEKNGEGNQVAIRADLAVDLRQWIKDKSQGRSCTSDDVVPLVDRPSVLPGHTTLFDVPTGLLRILNRDLKAAGIPKRDDRGRTVDVHAIRHSFGTLLSVGGVAPRTAQAAMRHSTIDLTMNVYTDPRLLDVHGALDSLPAFKLGAVAAEAGRANGTTGEGPKFAPKFAPRHVPECQKLETAIKLAVDAATDISTSSSDLSDESDSENHAKAKVAIGCQQMETKGLEPSTPALQRRCSPN